MVEITLDEAKHIYGKNAEIDNWLLTKFSKKELEGNTIPTQEEFNKFVRENIFTLINYSKTKFLDIMGNKSKIPTSRIILSNYDGEWLFDYNYDQKNTHFWYSYNNVYVILINKFHIQVNDITRLMKGLVGSHFNLRDTQPVYSIFTEIGSWVPL